MRALCSVVLCVLIAAATGGFLLAAEDQPMIGEAAPTFELPSLSGNRVSLEDYRGETLVLHFGAGW